MSGIVLRDKIFELQAEMLKLPQLHIPAGHFLAHGVYAREIFIPKGTLLVGKIHRFSHINIISKGDITVITDTGRVRIVAPHTLVAPAGVKRAGYAHEDTIWTTIHATTLTDVEAIERGLIEEEACLSSLPPS